MWEVLQVKYRLCKDNVNRKEHVSQVKNLHVLVLTSKFNLGSFSKTVVILKDVAVQQIA